MQSIELGAPAVLPLGMASIDSKPALLHATLQHPPVNLLVKPGSALSVTGARADLAHTFAENFCRQYNLDLRVTIEIELAIPNFMGLGSAPALALSVATGLARWYELTEQDPQTLVAATGLELPHAVAVQAGAEGGLTLSDWSGTTIERRVVSHANREAWAFVMVLPRVEPTPEPTFEADRLSRLGAAAAHVDHEHAGKATSDLLTAVDADDFKGFCAALEALQVLNDATLDAAGVRVPLSDWEQRVCGAMRTAGAAVVGRSMAGATLYGLTHGDRASIALRQVLRSVVAPDAGRVMAAIIDNEGVRVADTR